MLRKPLALSLFALAAITSNVSGQQSSQRTNIASKGAQTADCRIDTTAAWHRKQRAWLDDSGRGWSNDSLRNSLLMAAGITASASIQLGVQIDGRDTVPSNDALRAFVAELRKLPRGSTWPTRSVVGAAGARAMWLMALSDTSFTNMAMHRMMEAGPVESLGADVAVLEDRTRLAAGRKQLFGTQFRIDQQGRVVLAPMEDSAHADLRREEAGLPPFKLGLCLAAARR